MLTAELARVVSFRRKQVRWQHKTFVYSGRDANDALHVLKPWKPAISLQTKVMWWDWAEQLWVWWGLQALPWQAGLWAQPSVCCSILSGVLHCVGVMWSGLVPSQACLDRLSMAGCRWCCGRSSAHRGSPCTGGSAMAANRSHPLLTIASEHGAWASAAGP